MARKVTVWVNSLECFEVVGVCFVVCNLAQCRVILRFSRNKISVEFTSLINCCHNLREFLSNTGFNTVKYKVCNE